MPPKPKFSKDEILNCALDIAAKDGIESVVAREVAKRLGTTTSPIFTFFSSMDELKSEVYNTAQQKYIDYLKESVDYFPSFKEFGFRFINFAINNPKIYQMIFHTDKSYDNTPVRFKNDFGEVYDLVKKEIQNEFDLSEENSYELLKHMLIFGNGIASLIISGAEHFSKEQISKSLSESCLGAVMMMKMRNNSFEPKKFEQMICSINNFPEKNKLSSKEGNCNAEN